MREEKHSNIDINLYAETVSCGIGGEKRKAIAILFQALMEATAAVRNTNSLSPNSLCTAEKSSSATPDGVT